MLREHWRFFLWATLGGLALRLFFLAWFPAVTDDSRVYLDLASNWLRHGIYGQTQAGQIVAAGSRLPGYPAFLAGILSIFGIGNVRAVLLAQIFLDLGCGLLIADLARRTVRHAWAGRITYALAATCPFLANYAAAVLTETLEIFFTALALDCAVAGLDRFGEPSGKSAWAWMAGAGAAIGASILVRPDGGILLASIVLFLAVVSWTRLGDRSIFRQRDGRAHTGNTANEATSGAFDARRADASSLVRAAILLAVVALASLVPWTIRNLRTFHHFQPLAPRYATESEELAPRGFNRWVQTWMAEYVSVEEVYWNVPGDKIDITKLPARALDEPGQAETLATVAEYNQSQDLTPELDARFGTLAAERMRAHPLRSRVLLPALRVADMWLRPRTELLPPDPRWWEFNDAPGESALAIGFGLLNLAYLAAAALALAEARVGLRYIGLRYVGLLGGFVVLRTAFLWTIENPEPRYTLECYPVVLVWAAAFFASKLERGAGR